MLFYDCWRERKVSLLRDDYRFSEQGTALCSADIKDITESCKIGKADIVFGTGEGIGKACSVDIKRKLIFIANIPNILQFFQRIERAEFRGLREVNEPWLHHVCVVSVGMEVHHILANLCGINLSLDMGKSQNLVSMNFDNSRLVGSNVRGIGCNYSFIRA